MMFENIRYKVLAEAALIRAVQKGSSSIVGAKRLERPIRLFVTTWNTGDKGLPNMDNQPWLEKSHDADVIAIGVQEAKVSIVLQRVKDYFEKHQIKVVLVNNSTL